MSKQPEMPTRSGRLIKAVRSVRDEPRPDRPAVATNPSKASTVDRKLTQRPIKFANASTALRQHVTQAKDLAKPASYRLRVPKPDILSPVRHESQAAAPPRLLAPRVIEPSTPMTRLAAASDLGALVREARARQGLSQSELASLAETGRRFVSELEAGKPSLEFGKVIAVCNALRIGLLAGVSTDER